MRGVEPPRAEAHRHLKPARLPIPPHPRFCVIIRDYGAIVKINEPQAVRYDGIIQLIWM